ISLINNDEENLIRIVYASINFKDVMITSGRPISTSVASFDQNNSPLIGMEFRICANICVVDKYLSWIIPEKWTMEDAATVPLYSILYSVYSTCYYALYLRGKMKRGQKVLIHSGTGGVGQAAIYLALYESCEVFITVGSVEKRDFIRKTFPSISEIHIGNSRDTSFEQMIIQMTEGRGVNIVLNSLAEEKLQASIRCLAKDGRFLEIGMFDMISNNTLEIFVFSKGISFHCIKLDELFSAKQENKIILSNKIIEGIKKKAIKPLCRKIFGRDEIETAFRYMTAGKHIGKNIIKIHKKDEPLEAPILAHPRYYCLEHKCYIVLGGLGGFGIELIDWLILRGAKHLIVTSRTGIKNGYQRSRVTLWQSYGVNIHIVTVLDTSRYKDCESILKFAEEQGPVDAIFNLAVVLRSDIFKNQSPQTFEESFMLKAWTTKKMDELSRTICTQFRHFVVFSSIFCGRGNAGQTNYGMSNSVMERICERRRKEGLHGLAIQWGAIGEVGLVADMQEDMQEDDKELIFGGTSQKKISSCLDTLEVFLLQDRSIVSSIVVAEKKNSSQAMNPFKAVVNIMGLKNLDTVAPNVLLADLGMDSMMAVEIKQTLENEFDILLTEQDILNLNLAALRKMTSATEQEKNYDATEAVTNNLDGVEALTRKLNDSDFNPAIYVELNTKEEIAGIKLFLIPGIDGSAGAYKRIESKIKSLAMCLQHGALNMPDVTRSIMKSAAFLLPYIMKKMKEQEKFLIVGYSFGSLIAIELARLLEAKNFVGRLILIDGAPDWVKFLVEKFFNHTLQQELQNDILLRFMKIYLESDNKMSASELNKCSTWEEKLELLTAHFSEKINVLSVENQKFLYTTIYHHIIAVQGYDISLLPPLKSSIILLKPTLRPITFPEEDYGLHKITESAVQIHYVQGSHITMIEM
ncbi:fatty acid synthase-like, partial [Formica exsecta]|uniref:fatty acid synthase-like n=1 Tax=Formica exsecta TaxID=72781 RepID=UPI0011439818